VDRQEARRVGGDLGAGRRDRLLHDVEDVHPAGLRLRERLLEDLAADAGDLDVHLEGGDPLRVPATLKSMSP
jgi:hypothetical protein